MCWKFINFLLSNGDKNEKRKSTRRDSEKEIELKTGTSEEAEVKALFDLFDNDGDRFLLFIRGKYKIRYATFYV